MSLFVSICESVRSVVVALWRKESRSKADHSGGWWLVRGGSYALLELTFLQRANGRETVSSQASADRGTLFEEQTAGP
jgi:hypothetical protein